MQRHYTPGGDRWLRVTAEHPCPVCNKPDWCCVATDGSAALCQRVESGNRRGDAGWLHRLTDDIGNGELLPPEHCAWLEQERQRAREAAHNSEPAPDWPELAGRFYVAAAEQRQQLADDLGVTAESLGRLGCGWDGSAWTFPEWDGSGNIIGISRRFPGGKKAMATGSRRGLMHSMDWQSDAGPVLLVEGVSDTAAGLTLGLCCIGRPSNTGGVDCLAELLAGLREDRPIIVLGERDTKDDGSWPGKTGAISTAEQLAERLNRPVAWALPPDEAKDLRSWLQAHPGCRDDFVSLLKLQTVGPQLWPEIDSIESPAVPPFPVNVLPADLRDWTAAESHATQTPVDLPAMVALSICAAALAKRVSIEAWDGWREPVNTFAAVVLPPGNRKSAVFRDGTSPLRELEQELIEQNRDEISRAKSLRRQKENRLKRLESQAASGDREAEHEACQLAAELAAETPPARPQLIVSDATSEALARELMLQGGRLASMSAEGDVFGLMAGRYRSGGATDFDVYLKGHAGDDMDDLRIGREKVSVRAPALTCCYTVQPSILDDLQGEKAFRGRGLMARFAWAMPDSPVGSREIRPPAVHPDVWLRYRGLVRRLHSFDLEAGHVLRLSPEAVQEFESWSAQIEAALGPTGRLHPIVDWAGKLPGHVLRLAGILHCCEQLPEVPVQPETIAAAVAIGEYLIPHAERVLVGASQTTDRTYPDAVWILQWIRRHRHQRFTRRDVWQAGKHRFERSADIAPALALLCERGYLRENTPERAGPGRKPSETFDVNPLLAGGHCLESVPTIPAIAARPVADPGSGDSGGGHCSRQDGPPSADGISELFDSF